MGVPSSAFTFKMCLCNKKINNLIMLHTGGLGINYNVIGIEIPELELVCRLKNNWNW